MAQNIEIIIRAMDRATPAIRSTENSLRSLGKTSSFVGDTLKFFAQAQVFGGLMALQAGLVGSVGAGIKFNSSMELARMRWTELTGSASQGQGMVDMILRVAKETSFTTDQINNYATQLAGAGVKSKDLESKLMGLANVTAKYGLTNDQAQMAIRGYTQAIGKGKISVEELNQMQENGIPIYQILRDELGLTSAEIQGAGKDAKTSALIIDFLNNKFLDGRGAIEAYGQTFAGRLDKMKDTFTQFAGALTQPIFEKLKQGMTDVTNYMDRVRASMEKGKSAFASLRDAMSPEAWNVLATAMGVVASIGVFKMLSAGVPVVMRLVNSIKNGGTAFKLLRSAISPVGLAITAVSVVVGFLVKNFMNAYKSSATLRVAVAQIGDVFKVAWDAIKLFGSMLVEIAGHFTSGTSSAEVWTAVIKGISIALQVVITVIAIFADILYSIISIVAGVVKSFYALGLSIASVAKAWAGDFTGSAKLAKEASNQSKDAVDLMSQGFKNFSTWEISNKVAEGMGTIGTDSATASTEFDANMLAMKSSMATHGDATAVKAKSTGSRIKQAIGGSTKGTASMMSGDLAQNITALNQFQARVNTWSAGFRAKAKTWFVGIGSTARQNFNKVNTESMSALNNMQSKVNAWSARFRASAKNWFTGIPATAKSNFAKAHTQSVAELNAMQSRVNAKAKMIRTSFVNQIKSMASDAKGKWNTMKSDISSAMSSAVSKVTSGASKMRSSMSNGIKGIVSSAKSGFNSVKSAISSAMSSATSKVVSGGSKMRSAMASAVKGIVSAVTSGFRSVASAVSSGISRALSAIQSKVGSFRSAGAGLISALTGGITSKMQGAISAVSGLAGKLRSFLPGSDAERGALSDLTHSGKMLPVTFAQGIAKGSSSAVNQANMLARQIDTSLQSEVGARMFASGSSVTVYHRHEGTVNVNGSGIGQADQFVAGSIGYEVGVDGIKQAIRSRTGGR